MADTHGIAVNASDNRADIPVYPLDVYLPSDRGKDEIRRASTRLPVEALELLVLMDGKATVGDLEQLLPEVGAEAVRGLVRCLIAAGLARPATVEESLGLDFSAFFAAEAGDAADNAGAQASAAREARVGSPMLEREGYYVSIARQAVRLRERAPGARFGALIVEDDPDVATLVAKLLADEGFDSQIAAAREAVLARIRQPPLPDIVILDVMLPDVNGFDLLQKFKSHPALKGMPVIMLTAEARRESVTRGLALGADGYLTKPFERAKLIRGVKAVLGVT